MHGAMLWGVAVALAMDAFAVSVASGAALGRVSWRQTLRLAWHFGLFQAGMPVLGWALGRGVADHVQAFDHWIAFGLLLFVGGKMILDAIGDHEEESRADPTRGASLVLLSVATSIDALAVGFSLSVLGGSVWGPALVIGGVCFLFTVGGLHLGRAVRSATGLGRLAEVLGGVVLLAIGLNILREHGVFGG